METSLPSVTDFVRRLLAMREQQEALRKAIKEIYEAAKDAGFDPRGLAKALSEIRRREGAAKNDKLEEFDAETEMSKAYVATFYSEQG